jgi:hypothetical protein
VALVLATIFVADVAGAAGGPHEPPRILQVADGCLLRVLEGLMTLKLRGAERQRLSYRSLDVEQIGSVYETVMGFTVEATTGRARAIYCCFGE